MSLGRIMQDGESCPYHEKTSSQNVLSLIHFLDETIISIVDAELIYSQTPRYTYGRIIFTYRLPACSGDLE